MSKNKAKPFEGQDAEAFNNFYVLMFGLVRAGRTWAEIEPVLATACREVSVGLGVNALTYVERAVAAEEAGLERKQGRLRALPDGARAPHAAAVSVMNRARRTRNFSNDEGRFNHPSDGKAWRMVDAALRAIASYALRSDATRAAYSASVKATERVGKLQRLSSELSPDRVRAGIFAAYSLHREAPRWPYTEALQNRLRSQGHQIDLRSRPPAGELLDIGFRGERNKNIRPEPLTDYAEVLRDCVERGVITKEMLQTLKPYAAALQPDTVQLALRFVAAAQRLGLDHVWDRHRSDVPAIQKPADAELEALYSVRSLLTPDDATWRQSPDGKSPKGTARAMKRMLVNSIAFQALRRTDIAAHFLSTTTGISEVELARLLDLRIDLDSIDAQWTELVERFRDQPLELPYPPPMWRYAPRPDLVRFDRNDDATLIELINDLGRLNEGDSALDAARAFGAVDRLSVRSVAACVHVVHAACDFQPTAAAKQTLRHIRTLAERSVFEDQWEAAAHLVISAIASTGVQRSSIMAYYCADPTIADRVARHIVSSAQFAKEIDLLSEHLTGAEEVPPEMVDARLAKFDCMAEASGPGL